MALFGLFKSKPDRPARITARDQRIVSQREQWRDQAEEKLEDSERSFSKIVDHAGSGELMAAKFEADNAGFGEAARQFEHMIKFGTKSDREQTNRIALAGAQCRHNIEQQQKHINGLTRTIDGIRNK